MPITFTNPPGHFPNWFGPGVVIDIGTSIADPQGGPFTIGGEFRFGTSEQLFYSFSSTPQTTATYRHQMLYQPDGTQAPLLVGNTLPIDTDLTLSVQIRTDSGAILDQGTTQRKWNPTANEHLDIAQLLRQQIQGGFTANDRAEAETTQLAVQANFPRQIGSLPDLVVGVGELLDRVGAQLLVPAEPVDLSGRGSLERPRPGLAINAYGLYWVFKTVPPGFGARDGAVLTYFERIIQFVRVDVDRASNEYLGDVFDIRTSGGRIVWGFGIPRRILYDVTPHCVVTVYWLLL